MTFHPISVTSRSDYPRMVSVSEVKYHNIPFGFDTTMEKTEIFSVFDAQTRIMPYKNRWQTAVTFEFWDTKTIFIRVDYGFLDWLSDIGGLYNILMLIAFMFIERYI